MTSDPRADDHSAGPRKRMFLQALARLVAKRVLGRLNLKAIHNDEGPDENPPPSGSEGEEADEERQSQPIR